MIAVHDLVTVLGAPKCRALPFFHALTGCDTVSCFSGKGKKSMWQTWSAFPDVTAAFLELSDSDHSADDISEATISLLERFIVVVYTIGQVS